MTFKVTDKYFKTIYTKEKNPTKSNIHFIIIDSWDSDSVIRLYKDAGWWKDDYSPDDIPKIIKESFRFCIGINTNTGETIATGRIISDGVRYRLYPGFMRVKAIQRYWSWKFFVTILNKCSRKCRTQSDNSCSRARYNRFL